MLEDFIWLGREGGSGRAGVRLNNFLQVDRCLGLVKYFTFFILIDIYGNSTIFQYFDTSIYSIKTLKFSRKFGLQGLNCDLISHKKSLSRNIKQYDNKETNMWSFK